MVAEAGTGRWSVVTTDAHGLASAQRFDAIGNLVQSVGIKGSGVLEESGSAKVGSESLIHTFGYGYDPTTNVTTVTQFTSVGDDPKFGSNSAPATQWNLRKEAVTKTTSTGLMIEEKLGGYNASTVTKRTIAYDTVGRPIVIFDRGVLTDLLHDDELSGTGQVMEVNSPDTETLFYSYDSLGNQTRSAKSHIGGEKDVYRKKYDFLSRQVSEVVSPTYLENFMFEFSGVVFGGLKTTTSNKQYSSSAGGGSESLKTETVQTSPTSSNQSTKYSGSDVKQGQNLDSFGNTTEQSLNGVKKTQNVLYDLWGNVTSYANALLQSFENEINFWNRTETETDPTGRKVIKKYDPMGRLFKETVEAAGLPSQTTTYHHDPYGRLTKTVLADGKAILREYDAFDNLIQVTDPVGNSTTWTYDVNDRKTSESKTVNGTVFTTNYEYDVAGRVSRVAKPNGQRIDTDYNPFDHSLTETWWTRVGSTTNYNRENELVYRYDILGNLVSAEDDESAVSWKYDKTVLVEEKQLLPGSNVAKIVYTYQNGAIDTMETYVNMNLDNTLDYNWNGDGSLQSIRQIRTGSKEKKASYDYNDAGRTRSIIRTESSSSGSSETRLGIESFFVYGDSGTQTGQLVSISHSHGNISSKGVPNFPWQNLAHHTFQWDGFGRLKEYGTTRNAPIKKQTYTYDIVNQLTDVQYTGLSTPAQSYGYDDNGNRNTNGNEAAPAGGDNRQLSDSDENFTYDKLGNLVERSNKNTPANKTTYTYDHRNRLTSVTTVLAGTSTKVSYEYDALNRRIARYVDNGANGSIENTQLMVNHGKRSDRDNAGDSLAMILDGDGKVTNRYLYGALVDEVLAEETLQYDANNNVTSEVLWALSDHQGSVRDWAKIGSEVSVVKHVDYDPFGNVIDTQATNAAIATMFGFTGRSTDPLTKLQDNRARAYDPTLGRFISQDPMGFAAGDANLYRYTGNSPTNRTDPSGLSWLKKIKFVLTEGGEMVFENGKKVKMRNWEFRNKSIGIDDLRNAGLQDSASGRVRLKRLQTNHPDLKIKYDKYAQPDFSEVAERSVKVTGMNGDAAHDASLAWNALKKEMSEADYEDLVSRSDQIRLHHASDGKILVVDVDIHNAFAHSGAASIMRASGKYAAGFAYTLFAPGLSKIREDIQNDPQKALLISDGEIILEGGVDVLRWFDPFFEDIYDWAKEDIPVRYEAIKNLPETMERAEVCIEAVQGESGMFDWWRRLTGKWW